MANTVNPRVEARLAHLAAAARQAGVKLTHQRLEIFRELAAREDHPDADMLFRAVKDRMPTVSVDTIYRTLWLLHDLGLVATVGPQRGGVRFDANLEQHHHYVCVRCGLVRDFESASLDAFRVPDAVRKLGTVAGAHVEVRGVCKDCLEDAPTRATATATATATRTASTKSTKSSKKPSTPRGARE